MSEIREPALTPAPRPARDTAETPSARRSRRRKVLVVDRDETLLGFVAEALSSFRPGFDVVTATDPGHARGWLDTFSPDLVLVGLDGASVEASEDTWNLMADPRIGNSQVVALADGSSARARLDVARVGARVVLDRPPRLQALLSTVRRLI